MYAIPEYYLLKILKLFFLKNVIISSIKVCARPPINIFKELYKYESPTPAYGWAFSFLELLNS